MSAPTPPAPDTGTATVQTTVTASPSAEVDKILQEVQSKGLSREEVVAILREELAGHKAQIDATLEQKLVPQMTKTARDLFGDLLAQFHAQSALVFRCLVGLAVLVIALSVAAVATLFLLSLSGNHQAQIYFDGFWGHIWWLLGGEAGITSLILAILVPHPVAKPSPSSPPS